MELHTLDYKDWLINQKRLPDKASVEYKAFFDFHKELCLDGFMMDGTFINPFLYWHSNVWSTEVDIIDDKGRISQKYMNPHIRDNEWIITNEIHKANIEKKGLAIGGIRRLAKALRNDELLYTPDGPITIGECKDGDLIYDHTGELTTITGVFPQGKIPIYKMDLMDGRIIYCCENHIWRVKDRRYNKIKDLSIKELLPIYKKPRIHNGYKNKVTRNIEECFFAIPNNKVIQYSEKNLNIDPYFLGLWLGDGNSRNTGVTTIDKEIKDFIFDYSQRLNLKFREDGDTYFITSGILGGTRNYNILHTYFKELNIFKNKHIPKDYLLSSYDQRLALLQGLMDTDGCAYSNGTLSYVTTCEQLAEDFFSLCRSLGINLTKKEFTPKLYGVECGKGWLFTLFTELPIFRLKRKLNRIQHGNKGKQSKIDWTTIKNIELIGEDYATCITVDNKDKLFLTTDYTVTHNSVIEASYIAWGATFDENSQNVISGLNAADIKLITDKIDKGMGFIPDAWQWQRIEDNWKQQVTLGIKTKDGKRIPFSAILIRNLDEGNNEEAIAGTKPRKLIIDEGGKGSFLRGLQAAIPGFTTQFGWGCSPIVTFTGGDMNKFFDAKQLMFDVAAFNFMEYKNEQDNKRIHGLFLGHKFRMEAKVDSTLGAYLEMPKDSQLHQIPMKVSDVELADKITDENLARSRKAGDKIAYLKEKMYYPKEVDDIFLNESSNIFNIDAARNQQLRIKVNDIQGSNVELYNDGQQITHKFSNKNVISEYPVKAQSKDAPIVIWEMPIENPPFGLYVAGVDPYRQGKAKYSDSLGAVYIYKRMHDLNSEKFQNVFVASYVARPDKKEVWDEQARLLIKYYNARTLCENDEYSFIDYMKSKGDEHYLERQPQWISSYIKNTSVDREYGIHRSAEGIRDMLHNILKKYLDEVTLIERDENDSIIKEHLGVNRVMDAMLLEEIINFNDKDNFDREIAASLALALAFHLDPIIGKVGGSGDSRVEELFKQKPKNMIFKGGNTLFKNKSKLFKSDNNTHRWEY